MSWDKLYLWVHLLYYPSLASSWYEVHFKFQATALQPNFKKHHLIFTFLHVCFLPHQILYLHHKVRNSAIFISYPSPVFPWHWTRHTICIFFKEDRVQIRIQLNGKIHLYSPKLFFPLSLFLYHHTSEKVVCQDKSLDLSDFVSISVSWEHSNLLNWCKMLRTTSGYLIKVAHHYYLSSWL